jgi:hypothetical protein
MKPRGETVAFSFLEEYPLRRVWRNRFLMAPIGQANSQNFLNLSESGFKRVFQGAFPAEQPRCEVADAI